MACCVYGVGPFVTCAYQTAQPGGASWGLKAVVRQQLDWRVSDVLPRPAHSLWTAVTAVVGGPVHCSTCMHAASSASTHACGVPTPPLFRLLSRQPAFGFAFSQVGCRLLLPTPFRLRLHSCAMPAGWRGSAGNPHVSAGWCHAYSLRVILVRYYPSTSPKHLWRASFGAVGWRYTYSGVHACGLCLYVACGLSNFFLFQCMLCCRSCLVALKALRSCGAPALTHPTHVLPHLAPSFAGCLPRASHILVSLSHLAVN